MTTSVLYGSKPSSRSAFDVIVVGGGNAGFSAALAAAQRGREVLLLEKGTRDMAGGNSFYTAGATRITHAGLEELIDFIEPDHRIPFSEVPEYSAADYAADLAKVTGGRNDPDLTRVLVSESQDAVRWLHSLGLRYRLMYERQAYSRPDGTYLFWGGLHIGNVDGGVGLIDEHTAAANRLGVEIRYATRAIRLVEEGGRVVGVEVVGPDGTAEIRSESVVLAAGGFEANAGLRRQHLGPGWENAKVRGTPHNEGEMLDAALALGAARGGDWGSAHSVQWDAFTPKNESNRELTNRLTRQSYPLGILVNVEGERFLDEGADFRNYTYAKYGKEILKQPQSIAYQVFDAEQRKMLRTEEYDMEGISVETADTLDELAEKMSVDVDAFVSTVEEFNASIDRSKPFDPTVLDGRRADTKPPKSNWAEPIEEAPFYAYGVTCGITFTFGGLKGDVDGRVLDGAGDPIVGLFVCGEMLGGLFSQNYPGGSGLAAGMVFGRRAGSIA
jgi:Succinate dehydrogenase/fumarate reductase, flavoprotein subunit